jgi:hypothetical protein
LRYFIFLTFLFFLTFQKANAEAIQSRIGHLYWGLGPNFGLLGNVRLGFSSVEIGVLQNTGFGIAYVHRTPTPLFVQIGVLSTDGGGGIIGGGGMEWNTSSWFRWRTDITVSTDKAYQTQGFVSFGGVFIL